MGSRGASIGDRELDLLRWIERHGSASVGEAVEGFGADHELARSTVLTMMERLRKKGHLARRAVEGIYRYRVTTPARELVRSAVADFVEETLGGSLTPFVSYLVDHEEVTEREREELENLLERLRRKSEEIEP